jgi:taurine dioxygenase
MPPSIRKLTGRIGAVVEGIDFAAPPDYSTVTALRDALNEHKAIVFADVDLDNAGQERVAGWFGDLTTAHPNVPAADGTTNVLAVDSATSKANEWHTDVTFVVNPPQLTTLRSIVTTPYGGQTLIANAAAAYRDLPEPLRALADTLRVVHTNQYDYARSAATTVQRQEYDRAFVSTHYEAEHPVVRLLPPVLALHSDGPQSLISSPEEVAGQGDEPPKPSRAASMKTIPAPPAQSQSRELPGRTQEGRAA